MQDAFDQDVTIYIMTYNDSASLVSCLRRLAIQNLHPKVVVVDYGSIDGTVELLEQQIKVNYYGFSIRFEKIKFDGGKAKAKIHFKTEACKECTTKYMMFLTADILIPRFSIVHLITMLEKNEKIAVAGLKYNGKCVDHVQFGATVLRCSIAKKVSWNLKNQCTCRNARDLIKGWGYHLVDHPILTAIRIKDILEW